MIISFGCGGIDNNVSLSLLSVVDVLLGINCRLKLYGRSSLVSVDVFVVVATTEPLLLSCHGSSNSFSVTLIDVIGSVNII